MTRLTLGLAIGLTLMPSTSAGQPCLPAGWSLAQLEALKRTKFEVADAAARRTLALSLTTCLSDANPALRDGIAFEALTAWMRAGALDRPALAELRDRLMPMLSTPDALGFRAPFAALVLAEVARTDRISAWLSADEREAMVQAAATFMSSVTDYRAFSNTEGFRHGVAHGADFALQLALNPAVTKPQLDRLLAAVATQVAPPADVAYHAGEPDRLARPVLFIAQRGLHTEDEWKAWFAGVLSPKPLDSWNAAFTQERGLKKRHNTRAFLLSMFAAASPSENPAVRLLLGPVREGLKLLP